MIHIILLPHDKRGAMTIEDLGIFIPCRIFDKKVRVNLQKSQGADESATRRKGKCMWQFSYFERRGDPMRLQTGDTFLYIDGSLVEHFCLVLLAILCHRQHLRQVASCFCDDGMPVSEQLLRGPSQQGGKTRDHGS